MSNTPGGVENLNYGDLPVPEPAPGQALVKIAASGVNFIDIYFRTGLYKAPPPIQLGMEAAGIVERVGPDVTDSSPAIVSHTRWRADRTPNMRWCPPGNWCPFPMASTSKTAAAVMLQGMTAHYLTHSTFPLKSGDTCLVSAAAGGVGLLLVQMAKMLGATVIGMAGTEEKAKIATRCGRRPHDRLHQPAVRAGGEADHRRSRRRRVL